jgi:TolB-like protein
MIPVALAVVVAVLPFHDLTAGKGGPAGEALRETVTADLRSTGAVRVVEREALETAVRELDLRSKPGALSDPDPASTLRLGRLVGATHVVTGAYQRSGSTVRLTARVIAVETGEIVGASKVDGPIGDLFRLQDILIAELGRAVGLRAHRPTVKRPPVRDWKLVERYGDAVVETDDGKRRAILKEVLAVQPDFRWAAADLDALERRMLRYAAERAKAESARARDASSAFAAELARRDQWAAAVEKLEACRALGPPAGHWMSKTKLLIELAWAQFHLGHFRESAKAIAELRALTPSIPSDLARLETTMPVDD